MSVEFGSLDEAKVKCNDTTIINLSGTPLDGYNIVNVPIADKIVLDDIFDLIITVIGVSHYIRDCFTRGHNVFINCNKGINRSSLVYVISLLLIYDVDPAFAINRAKNINYSKNRPTLTNSSFHVLIYIIHRMIVGRSKLIYEY